jgi:hypothetical protein
MNQVDKLLIDAIDMHQHLGPSVIPRALDILQGAREAEAAGMKGIMVKDHQFPSMASVEIAKSCLGEGRKLFIGSSLVLNHEIGGLNVAAVETAINMGVNMIWLPTLSTENHHVSHEKQGLKFPASKKKIDTLPRGYIALVDGGGNVTEDVKRVLQVIGKDNGVILGAGHGTAAEINAIIHEAKKAGIEKIVVNHPTYMIDASWELMSEWAALGVFMEFGACTCDPISSICNAEIDQTVAAIKSIGVDHVTLASDYGQVNNPHPVEGLKHFAELLLSKGFTFGELEIMMKKNPANLLGI